MKKRKRRILLHVLTIWLFLSAINYIGFVFVSLHSNPLLWEETRRSMFIVFELTMLGISAALSCLEDF